MVQGLIRLRAKHLGEIARLDFTQHHIGICDRQRSAPPVAGRAGVSPCAAGAYPKSFTVKRQDGSPTRRHGVDAHHRCTQADPGNLGLELPLKLSGVMRDIGGRTAHIKTNDLVVACNRCGSGHANNAACRSAKDRVLSLKGVCIGQAT